jgi:hypothetical protein
MKTKIILSMVSITILGLCLLCSLFDMKNENATVSNTCVLAVYIAIILVGVSQLLNKQVVETIVEAKRLELLGNRNIFIYWVGNEYSLISILRKLMYLHSSNGKGYNVNLITDKNISKFIGNIPEYFNSMLPAHQADFVRVHVIHDYGGIWMDSDTLVVDSLDSLFDRFDGGGEDGFFIKENNHHLSNGIFGSVKGTPLLKEWKRRMMETLTPAKGKIEWTAIGNSIMEKIYLETPDVYSNYKIFNGLDNLYPVNWDNCVEEFITKPYDNYKTIVRDYQPLVVLVNSVYKELKDKTQKEILDGKIPLNYFINKSNKNGNS